MQLQILYLSADTGQYFIDKVLIKDSPLMDWTIHISSCLTCNQVALKSPEIVTNRPWVKESISQSKLCTK